MYRIITTGWASADGPISDPPGDLIYTDFWKNGPPVTKGFFGRKYVDRYMELFYTGPDEHGRYPTLTIEEF